MTGVDRLVRWSTAAVVVGVAVIAAWVSYEHAHALAVSHGEDPGTARAVPLTVDGLVYASSMVMLHCARHAVKAPRLAWFLLALGITATLGANVAHGLGHGPVGATVAAWPAVALVGTYELLMWLIRSAGRVAVVSETETAGVTAVTAPTGSTTAVTAVRPEPGLPTGNAPGQFKERRSADRKSAGAADLSTPESRQHFDVSPPAVATATADWLPARMPARAVAASMGRLDRIATRIADTEGRFANAVADKVAGSPRRRVGGTATRAANTPANTARRTREDFVNTAREAMTPDTDVTAKWVMDTTGCGRTTATSIAAELRASRLRLAEPTS